MPKIVNEWILVELLQLWNQFQKIPNFAQPIEVADKNWNKGLKHIHTTCKTHSKGIYCLLYLAAFLQVSIVKNDTFCL